MAAPIDFYFDFSSPYGYVASHKIDALAAKHGREAAWRPFLLGVAFKATGQQPLPSIPIKGDYAKTRLPAQRAVPRRAVPASHELPDRLGGADAGVLLAEREGSEAREGPGARALRGVLPRGHRHLERGQH